MRAYGNNREDCKMDQKRRYANCAPRAGDLREERAAKRKTRTEGEAEIREAVACMAAAEDDTPGDDIMRCGPDCPVCSGEPETAEDVFERTRGMRRAANMAVMGWSPS